MDIAIGFRRLLIIYVLNEVHTEQMEKEWEHVLWSEVVLVVQISEQVSEFILCLYYLNTLLID